MLEKRDLCWLVKKIHAFSGCFYEIDHRSDHRTAAVIQREMELLFERMYRSSGEDAAIKFRLVCDEGLGREGFRIRQEAGAYLVEAQAGQGLLYGMYGLYRLLLAENKGKLPIQSVPDQKIRMINHWDNFDGTIERGYAGDSIFFDRNTFRNDMDLLMQYARLLASVGINAVSINNVNVHRLETFFIEEDNLKEIKKIRDVFAQYGIKIFLCVNYAAPILVGKMKTADPLSPEVMEWWKKKISGIYRIIPDFGGFVVKADSEGEPGPFSYGRNHDQGANMLARAIKPYGGIIIWRCFVYNCVQDWRDRSLDRARAAYDIFKGIDGNFDDNVILQIKNGPIDFQIREPTSPLFGALTKTNQILEFQITQEYTGQQKDICYLVPMWKETLDFDTKYGLNGRVKDAIKKNSLNSEYSGIAGVGNVGMDVNWTGNKLAQANLYGFGRLSWDNELSSRDIAKEWIRASFSLEQEKEELVTDILVTSRETYSNYTCPLAVGFMCRPSIHYGVDIDGYEYDRWGTYHYADRNGVGRDRTQATGTGYTRQYSEERFKEYESLSACPDELLLFFHHVPYTHILKSGKTVIQHIYDSHFEGVEKVKEYQRKWELLENAIDGEAYRNVKERLKQQLRNAVEWRDQINTYFYRKSGIPDERGRKIYD